jgi:hypothetical protein
MRLVLRGIGLVVVTGACSLRVARLGWTCSIQDVTLIYMSMSLDEPTEGVVSEPAHNEPPITMIASYLSARLRPKVRSARRRSRFGATLRYARSSGAMEALADKIIEETNGDCLARRICDVLRM